MESAFKKFASEFKERFDVDGEDHAYKILGVQKSASMSDIKKAHRKLARETHPDKGGTEETFRDVQEAYETLKKVYAFRERQAGGGAAAGAA